MKGKIILVKPGRFYSADIESNSPLKTQEIMKFLKEEAEHKEGERFTVWLSFPSKMNSRKFKIGEDA